MVEFIGMLKVKVIKGTDLAVRDMMTSDPYVILKLGQQVGCSQFSLAYIKTSYPMTNKSPRHNFTAAPYIFLGNFCPLSFIN